MDPQDRDVQPAESVQSENVPYQFLTFTNFSQTTQQETKNRVRSYVQHRLQSKKRKAKPGEMVLDISPLAQSRAGVDVGPSGGSPIVTLPYPLTIGAGRSDPFAQYPINMDIRTHELFDHCMCYLP